MRASWRDRLASRLSCPVRRDYSLARCSTYRIGGSADVLIEPERVEDVVEVLQFVTTEGIPWRPIGLGSNVLFHDEGFAGVVIRIGSAMSGIEVLDGGMWHVGAGLPTPRLARRTASAGASGVHRLVGVPGTVGGGVFMNAGAHGQEFGGVVHTISLVAPDGSVAIVSGEDVNWSYRASGLSGIVVDARLALGEEDPAILKQEVRQYLSHRRQGTPFDQPCCGSVFRNPGVDLEQLAERLGNTPTAGRIIDAAGMRGFRIGAAEVSRTHANYIVNLGGATARDVLAVMEAVERRVHDLFGVRLRREVQVIASGSDGQT